MATEIPAKFRAIEIFQAFGRMVIGSYFIAKSSGLILDSGTAEIVFSSGTIPGYLILGSLVLEFIAAFFVLIGYQTAMSAGVLALYVFWTSFIFNYIPGDMDAISIFWKDLAMVGGLIMVIAFSRIVTLLEQSTRINLGEQESEEAEAGA